MLKFYNVDRWVSLAVEAQATGALDYSEISASCKESLYKEKLILTHLELARKREYKQAKCMYGIYKLLDTGSNKKLHSMFGLKSWVENENSELFELYFPWLHEEPPSKDVKRITTDPQIADILSGYKNAQK